MSKDNLTKILSEPKKKTLLSEERIKDIRKNVNKSRDRFLNPKIKKNRKNILRNRKQKRIFVMIAVCNIGYFCKF